LEQEQIYRQVIEAAEGLLGVSKVKPGQILVVGCSTSEVAGARIGKGSNIEVARAVVKGIFEVCEKYSVNLAAQCCEHLNRALVVEEEVAEKYGFEVVSVVPALHAGGAFATCVYQTMKSPVVAERIKAHFGLDIGDTFIGMHLKHVAVPVRLEIDAIGNAHLTAARYRPKLIGGARAQYEANVDTKACKS